MRGIIGLALCGLLTAGSAQAADCGLKQIDSIPVTVTPPRIYLPLTLAGQEKKFAFQLESSTNEISEDVSGALDFYQRSIDPHVTITRNGRRLTHIAVSGPFQLGKIAGKDMEFLVMPRGTYPADLDGIIGTHSFQSMDFELDLAGGKLNLFMPDHCPGNVVYWTKGGFGQLPFVIETGADYMRVPMTLDGKEVRVALQTSGRSTMGMNTMRRLFGIDETSPDMTLVDTSPNGRKMYRYAFKSLAADALTISNPAIFVFGEPPRPECDKGHIVYPEHPPMHSTEQPAYVRCFGGADVFLGMSVLSKLHLYFSSKEQLLYLTPAAAH
jgi:hypothetical protein